jgi:hypothetical protein
MKTVVLQWPDRRDRFASRQPMTKILGFHVEPPLDLSTL